MAHDANGHEGLITPIIDAEVGPFPFEVGAGFDEVRQQTLKVEGVRSVGAEWTTELEKISVSRRRSSSEAGKECPCDVIGR